MEFPADIRRGAGAFAPSGEVETEGRVPGWDDGALSLASPGRLGSFLQWSSAASGAGRLLAQALQPRIAFAAGGEVEEEHGPTNAGGFLFTAGAGSLFPFLQWHNWYGIYRSTRDQVVAAGGEAGVAALAGAVTGPAGAAAAAAATALSNVAGNVVQQLSTQADVLRRHAPLPQAGPPQMRTPKGRLGAGTQIDRTTTINVIKSHGSGHTPPTDRLRDRALTYLSHLR